MDNPYAPPQAEVAAAPHADGVLRTYDGLVETPWQGTWPSRCVACGVDAPATHRVRLTHYPKWVILLFVLSRLFGMIAFFATRRVATLEVGLCDAHRRARRSNLAVVWGGTGLGALLFWAAIGEGGDAGLIGVLVSALCFLGAAIWAVVRLPLLKIKMVEPARLFVRADPRFADTLPPS